MTLLIKERDRKEETEKQYKLALEADPNDAGTHFNYGNFLSEIGHMKEAEIQYELGLEIDPKDVAAHSNYGLLLYEMGRMKEAEKQYKLALKIDPKKCSRTHKLRTSSRRFGTSGRS